jgi:hypothetical protein
MSTRPIDRRRVCAGAVDTRRFAIDPRCQPPGNPVWLAFSADSAQSLLNRKGPRMDVLIGVIITFLVIILVLYLVNMLPIDGRAKQIVRVIVIIIGVISLLKYLAVF